VNDLIELLECGSGKPGINPHVLPVEISRVAQRLEKTVGILVSGRMNGADPRKLGRRLLRPRHQRPRRYSTEQGDELATLELTDLHPLPPTMER
jgi:hypothetical protein